MAETDMPKPPEGHFFRVKANTNPFSRSEMIVELRKKYLIGSGKVSEDWLYGTYTPVAVRRAALRMANAFYAAEGITKAVASLAGDYPPKELN